MCAYVGLCIYARAHSIALTTAILYYILYTVIILQPKKPQLAFATSIFENHVFIRLFAFDRNYIKTTKYSVFNFAFENWTKKSVVKKFDSKAAIKATSG